MLCLSGGQVESLFDEALPVEVRELPADLAALDVLLNAPAVLEPVEQAWDVAARGHGRPTIPIGRFVRLMVIKQRAGWGYETLVREVSDSLHLRRFCLIADRACPGRVDDPQALPAPGLRGQRDDQHYRGHITLAGNRHARWLLIEAAWHYRHAPRRPAGGAEPDERAWQAQVRLHHRYRHLTEHGKRSTVANVAVARELVGF